MATAMLVKVAAILALGMLFVLVSRSRSAARRHVVLTLTVAAAALMPLLVVVAPAWGFALPPPVAFAQRVQPNIIGLVWITGAAAAFVPLCLGLVRLAWIARRGRRDVSVRSAAVAADVARELGVERHVRLLERDAPSMPMTWGVWRPKILLPAASRDWPAARLRAVLGHEIAHVQRADWFVQIAAEIVACVHWYNPLVWLVRRRLRIESDRACDDAVVSGLGIEGADYASELLGVISGFRRERTMWGAALAMARRGSVERRIRALVNSDVDRAPIDWRTSWATVLAFAATATIAAGFDPAASARASDRASLLGDVQQQIVTRFTAQEARLSFVTGDVSFWQNRIEGRVELQGRLGVDGALRGVTLIKPAHPDVAMAAEALVRQWRREPAVVRGVPVEVPIRMTVNFTKRR